jgi:FkbH-like protein
VCSKNNEADAREPFEKHPDMVLGTGDIAAFVANWRTKPENLRDIARILNIGLDALAFADDNPAEREIVRQMVPEIEVITLPADPAGYVRAVDDSLLFETASFTAEDAGRTRQYKARAETARLEASAESLEDFYESLGMEARIAPIDEMTLPRVVQLLGKTNQFNLTTRRHSMEAVRGFVADPECVHIGLALRDRFAEHGLVGVLIAFRRGETLDIDTWLMSCRVIGRTVENEMLAELCRRAAELGCSTLRGTYAPTAKNGMVSGLYAKFGFEQVGELDGTTSWSYDLAASGPITNRFIAPWEEAAVDVA